MLIYVVWLTAASFALLVAVDEEVAGALRAEGQQDTLQHSWQQSETQQEGPKGGIPHDGFYSKDLQSTNSTTRWSPPKFLILSQWFFSVTAENGILGS